ncbi:MAG: hypothetical protein A2896_01690 [Candidatus Nealsonbacteria bacterium RIFCSPLOWO2_01_FULL_43_32]|uniref:Ribosomal RNA large subunit methyltransferase E n=1 Tax=Candidatus Nealsonbacteria bacterium RIFCSPLOWO2_01_FULL_43_32 TaxID=1801672 RepID=A0A1G2EEW7_9BACT|nr:MAG: hypothetical protein A2896_01690 [Candidatus Nealsonbacteria bacterium RIFCSPLOWO2_01_FULL_43_32]
MYRKDNQDEFYTRLAQKQGYPARSVYKLKELDEKYRLIRKGDRVLDLGCAPGSWLLYLAQKVGAKGQILGFDTEDVKIPPSANIVFIKKSVFDMTEADLKNKFNVVVSDLSPKTSGIKFMDAGRSLEMAEKAFEIAEKVLRPGGNFVCKIFKNELSDEFFGQMKNYFDFAQRFKPKAVIKKSKELYMIGKGFRI